MSAPTPYNRQFNFADYQALHPATPLPANQVEAEYNAIKITLDQTLNNLALIQRADNQLANQTVGFDQLKPELHVGISTASSWVTAHNYAVGDTVFVGSFLYRCLIAHLSTVFATDLAAGDWLFISDFSSSGVGITDGDKGDITVSGSGLIWTIDDNAATFFKIQDIPTDSLIGRDSSGTGNPESITVIGGIEFNGVNQLQTSAFTGDATKTAGGTALTLATVNANVGSFGSAIQVGSFTVNGKGLITAASNTAIAITSAAVTDFGEAAQDAVGGILTDSSTIDFTYNDGANTITAIVIDASIGNTKLANVSTATFKGRTTGGTGSPEDLTATQATALLNVVVGDSGSGGTKGLVTAPGVGDAAAGKFLKADASWAVPSIGSLSLPMSPGGRLTLQTGVPVMTTTQAAKTTIYYSPYLYGLVPIYDGANWTMTFFAELSVATSDTTKSPAAIGASKVNDWFVWNDSGTLRVGHGPDWTSDTVRSAGTALVRQDGIWLNNVAITNGPAVKRGTYVGTTRSNGSSQLDWILGALSLGGTAGFFGVWNTDNRVVVSTQVRDDTNSWTLAAGTVRAANNSSTMRVAYVCGLEEDFFTAQYATSGNTDTGFAAFGVGYDSTVAFSGATGFFNTGGTSGAVIPSFGAFTTTSFGVHFFSAVETQQSAGTGTFFGDAGVPGAAQNGLTFTGRM